MLEFIAQNVQTILLTMLIIFLIGIISIVTGALRDDDDWFIAGLVIAVSCMIIGSIIACNTSSNYPVSNAQWKTIYKNDLKADIKVAYGNFSDTHAINTNKKQNIQDLQKNFDDDHHVIKIKLTATQGDNSVTKNVLLEKDNVIAKDIDTNNAQITKIEYRPIEGTAPKVFGIKSKPNKSEQDGEIRITFKSNTNKQLEALFKE